MKIKVLTIFPEFFNEFKNTSIIKRAQEKKLLELSTHNLRDYSNLKASKVDDTPYGGGAGMLMAIQPFHKALKNLKTKDSKVIYMSPQGKILTQDMANNLSKEKEIIILCGHYEGIDERVLDYVDMEVSIGDYILTGGEIASMVLIDSITRLIPDVITYESVENDSLYNGLLKYPQYTKPYSYYNKKVPDVLLSGHHKNIEEWRYYMSVKNTFKKRPDLIEKIKDTIQKDKILKFAKDNKF